MTDQEGRKEGEALTSLPAWDAANWGQIGMGDASAVGGAFVELMSNMAADSTSVAAQIDLFNNTMVVWQRAAERDPGAR